VLHLHVIPSHVRTGISFGIEECLLIGFGFAAFELGIDVGEYLAPLIAGELFELADDLSRSHGCNIKRS